MRKKTEKERKRKKKKGRKRQKKKGQERKRKEEKVGKSKKKKKKQKTGTGNRKVGPPFQSHGNPRSSESESCMLQTSAGVPPILLSGDGQSSSGDPSWSGFAWGGCVT